MKIDKLWGEKELNAPKIQKKTNEEKKIIEEEHVEHKKPVEDEVMLGRIYFPDNLALYVPLIPYL